MYSLLLLELARTTTDEKAQFRRTEAICVTTSPRRARRRRGFLRVGSLLRGLPSFRRARAADGI